MSSTPEFPKPLEQIAEELPIEWNQFVTTERKAQLSKILNAVFQKGGVIDGILVQGKILLGDQDMAFRQLMWPGSPIEGNIPFNTFTIRQSPPGAGKPPGESKHQLYGNFTPASGEPGIGAVLNINLSSDQASMLRELILNRVIKEIDALLG